MLSSVCTSHILQDLSLNSAVVSSAVELFTQKKFQLWTGVCTGTFIATAVKAVPRTIQEHKRLKLEIRLLSQNFLFVSCDSCDQRLLQSDYYAL